MGGILCNPPRACLGEGDHAKHGGGGREMLRDVAPKPESRTVTRSRRLRRVMSPPEIALWQVLRARSAGLKFRRQHPSGDYTLDFYCSDARLAIEIDGEAHGRGDRPMRDARRSEEHTSELQSLMRIS